MINNPLSVCLQESLFIVKLCQEVKETTLPCMFLLDLIMELVSMNVNEGFLAYGLEFQKKS